jgi:hypothetical protein
VSDDPGLDDVVGDDEGIDFDGPPNPRRVHGRLVPTRCTCNARSETPCDWCCHSADDL